jgi:hypothetical protein
MMAVMLCYATLRRCSCCACESCRRLDHVMRAKMRPKRQGPSRALDFGLLSHSHKGTPSCTTIHFHQTPTIS